MGEHSILPPSSAGIWGKPDGCTGWVLMAQQYPQTEETPESKEGTAAHEIGAGLIVAATKGGLGAPRRKDLVGTLTAEGVLITDEIFDGAELYANHVAEVIHSTSVYGGPHFGNEERVEIPGVHALNWGTPDQFIYCRAGGVLHIWDFKFGHGIVEAFENWQMIDYLAGLFERLGIDGHIDQHTRVEMHIIQPRGFHKDGPIRTWATTASNLRPYFNILNTNAHKALGPDAELRSGDHCRYCQARLNCPAAIQAGISLYEAAVQPPGGVNLSPESLGLQLSIVRRAVRQLEYLETAYTAQVETLVKSGKVVPGWGTEPAYGRKKWKVSNEEVLHLGDLLEKDLRKPDPITPTQAEALGIDAAVISAYSERPYSGLKVVPDDGTKAKRIFSND